MVHFFRGLDVSVTLALLSKSAARAFASCRSTCVWESARLVALPAVVLHRAHHLVQHAPSRRLASSCCYGWPQCSASPGWWGCALLHTQWQPLRRCRSARRGCWRRPAQRAPSRRPHPKPLKTRPSSAPPCRLLTSSSRGTTTRASPRDALWSLPRRSIWGRRCRQTANPCCAAPCAFRCHAAAGGYGDAGCAGDGVGSCSNSGGRSASGTSRLGWARRERLCPGRRRSDLGLGGAHWRAGGGASAARARWLWRPQARRC